VAWAALLALPGLEPRGPLAAGGLSGLRDDQGVVALALRSASWLMLSLLRAGVLGFLAGLALGRSPGRARRWALGPVAWAAAFATAAAAALAAAALASTAAPPLLFLLPLPALGAAAGAAAGLAWDGGWRARLRFIAVALGAGAALLLAAGAAAGLAVEREAAVPEPDVVSSADKRRLFEMLRGKNPRTVEPGATRTLRLAGGDVERLLAWAWFVQGRGRAAVRLEAPDRASGTLSVRIPRTGGRWVNLAAALHLRIDRGRIDARVLRLRIGRLELPGFLARLLVPLLLPVAQADPRLGAALGAVRDLRVEPDAVEVTYGRVEVAPGLLAQAVWGEEAVEAVRASVGAQVERLAGALRRTPPGDGRFGAALREAFALAMERTPRSSALEENRSALLALGIVLGHERLASVSGTPLRTEQQEEVRRLRDATTVRGRADWVRHFTVSCALTVLGSAAPSNAAGLFKEEKDAGSGSGFSFGDLLADRAGTTFAEQATRDEASAAAWQGRVVAGLAVDDVFPPAADLPEDIQDAELQGRYGGVGGPLFKRFADEIERRIASLPAYRR